MPFRAFTGTYVDGEDEYDPMNDSNDFNLRSELYQVAISTPTGLVETTVREVKLNCGALVKQITSGARLIENLFGGGFTLRLANGETCPIPENQSQVVQFNCGTRALKLMDGTNVLLKGPRRLAIGGPVGPSEDSFQVVRRAESSVSSLVKRITEEHKDKVMLFIVSLAIVMFVVVCNCVCVIAAAIAQEVPGFFQRLSTTIDAAAQQTQAAVISTAQTVIWTGIAVFSANVLIISCWVGYKYQTTWVPWVRWTLSLVYNECFDCLVYGPRAIVEQTGCGATALVKFVREDKSQVAWALVGTLIVFLACLGLEHTNTVQTLDHVWQNYTAARSAYLQAEAWGNEKLKAANQFKSDLRAARQNVQDAINQGNAFKHERNIANADLEKVTAERDGLNESMAELKSNHTKVQQEYTKVQQKLQETEAGQLRQTIHDTVVGGVVGAAAGAIVYELGRRYVQENGLWTALTSKEALWDYVSSLVQQ